MYLCSSLSLAISSNPLYNKFYIVLLHSVKLVMSKVAVPYNNMGEMAMEHLVKGKMALVFAFRCYKVFAGLKLRV